jgi:hypothetical protein
MKKKRVAVEQIVAVLKEAEAGMLVKPRALAGRRRDL